jgi:hypothetical protein
MKRSHLAAVLLTFSTATVAAGVGPAAAGDPDRPRDRNAPLLDISVTPEVLASPNGRFRTVRIAGEVEDDEDMEDVYLAEVESTDEGDDRDIAGARIGSFDDAVLLRAERSPSGEARTYRITFVAVDAAGNETRASAFVTVPPRGD